MDVPKIFTRNRYGVAIVKCCASCRFKQLDNRNRLCLNGEGAVPSSYVCKQWEMNQTMENVGKGDGNVKSSHYLHYSLDRLFRDFNESVAAAQNGTYHKRLSIADIRREYKNLYGEIYTLKA